MEREQTPVEPDNDHTGDITESRVVFPVESAQVVEFITSLLGKPQSLERSYSGVFSISHDDVVNTYQLIEQRIHQQNEASLVQFSVSIQYDDSSSIRLNSLSDFEKYSEVRPLICEGVTLTWIYLVKFQQKDVPEKQQIDLSFRTISRPNARIVQYTPANLRVLDFGPSGINLKISYTERTWGNDIDSLLDGHIKRFLKDLTGIKGWISQHSGLIGLLVGVLFFAGAMVGSIYTMLDRIKSNLEGLTDITEMQGNNIVAIHKKLEYIAEIVATGSWSRLMIEVEFFIFLSFIVSVGLGIWVGIKADNRPPSFILLSQESKNLKGHYEDKIKRDWMMFFISVAVSLMVGIVSNVLFYYYLS